MWLVVTNIAVAAFEFAEAVPKAVYALLFAFAFGLFAGCHGCR